MKNTWWVGFVCIALFFYSCSSGQSPVAKSELSATEFAEKINQWPAAPVLDVRTPNEFSKGHLINALNFDWNGNNFEKQIASLDKSQPVFVYCLSGGRSASAAGQMRSAGFKEVYELSGGILKWRAVHFPETTGNSTLPGMSKQQFDALLNNDKLVLIDFYADWCQPCKAMKPYLEEISKEMASQVQVVRINTDDHRELCKELNIDALPVLQLYKNKTLIWNYTGYIDKEGIVSHLN